MNINIALVLDKLISGANYRGSIAANSKESYDNLIWLDNRNKPEWDYLLSIAPSVERKEAILQRLKEIDNETIPRIVREFMLLSNFEGHKKPGHANGIIKDAEIEATSLRAELATL